VTRPGTQAHGWQTSPRRSGTGCIDGVAIVRRVVPLGDPARAATRGRTPLPGRSMDRCFPGLTVVLPDVLGTKVGRLVAAEFADTHQLVALSCGFGGRQRTGWCGSPQRVAVHGGAGVSPSLG
jgi:hypothetical protein